MTEEKKLQGIQISCVRLRNTITISETNAKLLNLKAGDYVKLTLEKVDVPMDKFLATAKKVEEL